MSWIIIFIGVALIVIAFLAIRFIQEETRQQNTEQESLSLLEKKVTQLEEQLKIERNSKQTAEDALFRARDELDILKNQYEEVLKKLKVANNEIQKKEIALSQQQQDKEKLILEVERLKKEIEPFQNEIQIKTTQIEELNKQLNDTKLNLIGTKELYEGLKGQYDELSKELESLQHEKINEIVKTPNGETKFSAPQEINNSEQISQIDSNKKALDSGSDLPSFKEEKGSESISHKPNTEDVKSHLKSPAKQSASPESKNMFEKSVQNISNKPDVDQNEKEQDSGKFLEQQKQQDDSAIAKDLSDKEGQKNHSQDKDEAKLLAEKRRKELEGLRKLKETIEKGKDSKDTNFNNPSSI